MKEETRVKIANILLEDEDTRNWMLVAETPQGLTFSRTNFPTTMFFGAAAIIKDSADKEHSLMSERVQKNFAQMFVPPQGSRPKAVT